MNAPTAGPPPELNLFQPPGTGGLGNVMYKVSEGDQTFLLKLYRRRWSRWQEWLAPLYARLLLGRTGGDARSRFETERACVDTWAREGFEVPRRFDKPLPPGLEPPGLWFEFCPGHLLSNVMGSPALDWESKLALLHQLGRDFGCRHARTLELGEPLLIQKHGSIKHVFVHEGRLIVFDLEMSYRPGFNLTEGLARELSGYLRSISKYTGSHRDEAFRALIEGYANTDLLRKIAHWGVHGSSIPRRLTRLRDRIKRRSHGKTEGLARLLQLLD